jgi:hypothetical protein
MNAKERLFKVALCSALLLTAAQTVRSQEVLWTVGLDDDGWPCAGPGNAGGPDACFVQENWVVNPLPGNPYSPPTHGQADNDYYFAGTYYYTIESNGVYDPIGLLDLNEEAAERALVPGDYEMRYHFNLPANLKPTDLLSVTFDAANLDQTDPNRARYGVSVYINNVLVQEQIVIRPGQLGVDYTTPAFTLASVNAVAGPDYDNIVSLKGTSYESDGGGAWMGIDYVQLNKEASALPKPVFPLTIGKNDDAWPTGDGGGENATFVEGNGTVNALPGSPTSTETAGGADNDYYFAGVYSTVIAGNGAYQPVGVVSANEEAAEGGFTATETELRYHFNIPTSLQPGDLVAVTFDPLSLDANGADRRYGVEVLVNGVLVQPEVLVRPAQLGQPITTPSFTLASVNAQYGLGPDNVITLRGINYSASGGGNSLKLDFVGFKAMPNPPMVPWSVGRHDFAWPAGDGGEMYASFVQENGVANPLPGIPNSPETNGNADDDYYLAGVYNTLIPANGTYTPVGVVAKHEEAAERAFVSVDNDRRYHFNLPTNLPPDAKFTFSFSPMSLDDSVGEPRYGASVTVNNIEVMPELIVTPDKLNQTVFTPPFTLAQVGAQVGPGFDNIVDLKGVNYNAEGGGNWMGFDYVRLDPVLPPPWPLSANLDNNGHAGSAGGGPNANFVQEGGINPLPGNPAGGEINGRSDDDYYFAGIYTNTIPQVLEFYTDQLTAAYGAPEYQPVGTVLVNEYAAERAFAGADNEKRYHFNLPSTLKSSDQLVVSFDALDLDGGGSDPRYGVEIYFNGTKVKDEVLIRQAEVDVDYMTTPFTLESVHAGIGPGYDNIVTLRGINYGADGGGNWMGIDYVNVDPMPQPVFPLAVGRDDDGWPTGDGGGANASFVQENGTISALPGNPRNRELNQQADNDYYFAGVYTQVIPDNGPYDPVGIVPRNEEAAERAFAGGDNDLRYHFNLPNTLKLTDKVEITFDPFNLQDPSETLTDPHYGIEVYFNNVQVQSEIVIHTNDLGVARTTAPFTLASVNAGLGSGYDNIVSLRGINYNADGGGNWMGIDYVQINAAGTSQPLQFTSSTVKNGTLTLTWVGTGILEAAPSVTGPWNIVAGTPASPYSESVVLTQAGRFFRLKKP